MYQSINKVTNGRIPLSSLIVAPGVDESFSTENVNSYPMSRKNDQFLGVDVDRFKTTYNEKALLEELDQTISEKDKDNEDE